MLASFVRADRLPIALALAAALAGCSFVPPDQPPAVKLTPGWKSGDAPAGWVDAAAAQAWQAGRWWQLFGDAQLDALVARVELGNQNLALAVANVAQAEALLRQVQAQLWPTLGAELGQQRGGRPTHGSASVGLTASWAARCLGPRGRRRARRRARACRRAKPTWRRRGCRRRAAWRWPTSGCVRPTPRARCSTTSSSATGARP